MINPAENLWFDLKLVGSKWVKSDLRPFGDEDKTLRDSEFMQAKPLNRQKLKQELCGCKCYH